jgi:glycosyltransferase involved in cell wall biosynthesis
VKILHLIPSLTGGGAERQLAYLTLEMRRRGHQVRIAYKSDGPAPWQAEDLPAHRLAASRHRNPCFLREIVALIRSWRPDVLQTWFVESDIVGGVAAALTRTPWVLREPSSGEFYAGRMKASLRVMVARLAADAIVANSEGGRAYWAKHARPRLISNAVPIEDIDLVTPANLGAVPSLVYAGRLETMKNVDVFLAAAAQLSEVSVIVCGIGPRRARLEQLAAELRIADRVRFTGYTRDIWPIVKGAALFVSLSDFEGSPNAVLEAFAAGTPALLSDIAAHRAIADDRSAYFVPLGDVGATAAVMRQALADRGEAAARARNARLRVASWSSAAMADAYEEVYRSLL